MIFSWTNNILCGLQPITGCFYIQKHNRSNGTITKEVKQMAEINFTKEVVWHHVNSALQANNSGKIETKMGMDAVTTRAALLSIDGPAPGAPTPAKILLISPSLAAATPSKTMKAAM